MNPEITAENIKQWLPGTFPGDMAIEPLEITDEGSTGPENALILTPGSRRI